MIPCQKVIGKACFKAFPKFARRAIAYRLLHLLIPTDIAKLLPVKLSDPLIAPGVTIPLNAKFPPGTCIIPGCDFPAGWDPDQEPPACAKSRALPPIAMVAGGANPNVFTSPGEPAASQVHPPVAPPAEELWFNEPFDNLTDNAWEITEKNDGEVSIVNGEVKLEAPAYGDNAQIKRTEARDFPVNMDICINLRITLATSDFMFQLCTGIYYISISWNDDIDIQAIVDSGWENIAPEATLNEDYEWRIEVRGNQIEFFLNDSSIYGPVTSYDYTPNKGLIRLFDGDGTIVFIDLFTIKKIG